MGDRGWKTTSTSMQCLAPLPSQTNSTVTVIHSAALYRTAQPKHFAASFRAEVLPSQRRNEQKTVAANGCGAISASSSVRGIIRLISSRNSRSRVRLATNSNPVWARLICFMVQLSRSGRQLANFWRPSLTGNYQKAI